jgi:hypothetical protein
LDKALPLPAVSRTLESQVQSVDNSQLEIATMLIDPRIENEWFEVVRNRNNILLAITSI